MRIIAGRWRGHRLRTVKGKGVRPTTDRVREAWMSALAPSIPEARVLDLYAGSGALGLEALSRGATEVVFVEKNRRALQVLRDNIETLGAGDRCTAIAGDALSYIGGLEAMDFDVALADPPYEEGIAARLVFLFTEKPFARELWVEHRSTEEISGSAELRQRRYGDTTLTTVEIEE
jgi:16S rRNA (guanine966-N2)-methyltransferase